MKKEYQKHIVSTKDHQVWLHRTSKDLVDKIMKEGLIFLDLSGTATLQSKNAKEAENSYLTNFGTRQAVIVVKIPGEIAARYYTNTDGTKGIRHEGYAGDKDVSYWHPSGKYAIQRQHIHGYIDKETNEYFENPYRDKPQRLTDKHFPAQLYGGLEKELIAEKPILKKEKTPKIKRGKLPPPPKEIILPTY
jgi:hypothetical protein